MLNIQCRHKFLRREKLICCSFSYNEFQQKSIIQKMLDQLNLRVDWRDTLEQVCIISQSFPKFVSSYPIIWKCLTMTQGHRTTLSEVTRADNLIIFWRWPPTFTLSYIMITYLIRLNQPYERGNVRVSKAEQDGDEEALQWRGEAGCNLVEISLY